MLIFSPTKKKFIPKIFRNKLSLNLYVFVKSMFKKVLLLFTTIELNFNEVNSNCKRVKIQKYKVTKKVLAVLESQKEKVIKQIIIIPNLQSNHHRHPKPFANEWLAMRCNRGKTQQSWAQRSP